MKKEQGITLIALSVTIIVLLIIAGISVYSGKDIIKKGKLEELKNKYAISSSKSKRNSRTSKF